VAKTETKDKPPAVAEDDHAEEARKPGTALAEYGADAGAGFEDVGSDEILLPFFRPVDAKSKLVTEGEASYNPEAKPGMIVCTATGELYDGRAGVGYVPTYRDHQYVEWVPLDAGGGFVGTWDVTDPRIPALKAAQGQFGKLTLESGNELVETFSLYGLLVPMVNGKLDEEQPAIGGLIAFSSTQIKTYKMITTRLAGLIGSPPRFPLFAHVWHLRTVPLKNKKGSWQGWVPGLYGGRPETARLKPGDPIYLQARDFYQLLKSGKARADFAGAQGTAGTDDGGAMTGGEEIPF
jgi:hypothetical protein